MIIQKLKKSLELFLKSNHQDIEKRCKLNIIDIINIKFQFAKKTKFNRENNKRKNKKHRRKYNERAELL